VYGETLMSLLIRLDKFRHLAQEIELSFAIACALPTDHLRRVFSRRVTIRVKDFIDHARQLRKPLTAAGFQIRDFHERKEAYAQTFLEYFPVFRDKMGAHVQDIDLAGRLELWSSVEIVKLRYFVDGAIEIYGTTLQSTHASLGSQAYQPFRELKDPRFQQLLTELEQTRSADDRPRFTVDLLAGTRAHDMMMINESPPHLRSKQLVSLIEWVDLAQELLPLFSSFPNAARIVKAQLITDVVSMADCLVTRPLNRPTAQSLKGLDAVLRDASERPVDIEEFTTAFRFREFLDSLRVTRDEIGGHMDGDVAKPLEMTLALLDGVALLDVHRFYDKMCAVFRGTCTQVFWLRSYLAHNERLLGAVQTTRVSEYVTPFDDKKQHVEKRPRPFLADFSSTSLRQNLETWVQGKDQEDIGHYFSGAFMHSTCVERGGRDKNAYELKSAHIVVLDRFFRGDQAERRSLLELMDRCRCGYPKELIETTLRLLEWLHGRNDHTLDKEIQTLLSMMPHDEDDPVSGTLRRSCDAIDPELAENAAVSLYIFLARPKSGPALPHPVQRHPLVEIKPYLERLSQVQRLLVLLRIASAYTDGTRAANYDLVSEYDAVQETILHEASAIVGGPKVSTLEHFLRCNDYVSIGVLCGDRLRSANRVNDADTIDKAVAEGVIKLTRNFAVRGTAKINRALALLRVGRASEAAKLAQETTRSYPGDVGLKLTCLQILAASGVNETDLAEMAAYVRRSYNLDANQEGKLKALEGIAIDEVV
jgi:hypothetical protein